MMRQFGHRRPNPNSHSLHGVLSSAKGIHMHETTSN